jgi:hypothetical protein
MRIRTWSRALSVALFASLSCLPATSGAAASEPRPAAVGLASASTAPTPGPTDDPTVTWGARPADNAQGASRPHFSYTLAPGAHLEDAWIVLNHGDKPLTLDVYAADGLVTPDGQLNVANRDVAPVDVGSWVDVDADHVTIPPGKSAEIPFTITIPSDATPGDHTGGIVSSLTGTDPAAVTVERRLGARIYVRVDGELRPALRIERLTASHAGSTDLFPQGPLTVSFTVTNSGNTRMAGAAAVRLRGPFGLASRVVPLDDLPELLPGSSYDVSATVPDVPATVRLSVTAVVTPTSASADEESGTPIAPVEARTSVWAMPWIPVGIVVLVLAWLAPRCVRRVRAWRTTRQARAAGAESQEDPDGGAGEHDAIGAAPASRQP